MAHPNLGVMLVDIWETMLRETEDPFADSAGVLSALLGGPQKSYRDVLDRTRINHFGEVIPRIATVRRNIRFTLADPKLPASRLPL